MIDIGKIKALIRDVPDFPKPGVLFRDITPLLAAPDAFDHVTTMLSASASAMGAQAIVGIESRGFIFGAPVADRLELPFIPIRKPGKLPSDVMSVEYSLEYGTGRLDIHRDAFKPGQEVVIIDDVLATGGTARASVELVEKVGGRVAGLLFLIELDFLKGRKVLGNIALDSLIHY